MTKTETASQVELSDAQLHTLHQVQLDIAKQVKRVCDDHGLEYFLIAGTLLGAVRHGGFIPWDDDMDLGMPRDSYDRFLEVAPHELGPEFFVQTLDTDPGYGLCFAKVRLNGTALIEASSAKTTAHNGIFVDVFPFDSVPDHTWQRRCHNQVTSTIKRVVLLRQGYTPWFASKKAMSHVFEYATPLAKLAPMTLLAPLLGKAMRWFNSDNTEFMTAIGGSYGYYGESIERRWMNGLTEIAFEDTYFKCLAGSSEYLTQLYGAYMTPPAAENRHSRHGIIGLDFGSTHCTQCRPK